MCTVTAFSLAQDSPAVGSFLRNHQIYNDLDLYSKEFAHPLTLSYHLLNPCCHTENICSFFLYLFACLLQLGLFYITCQCQKESSHSMMIGEKLNLNGAGLYSAAASILTRNLLNMTTFRIFDSMATSRFPIMVMNTFMYLFLTW